SLAPGLAPLAATVSAAACDTGRARASPRSAGAVRHKPCRASCAQACKPPVVRSAQASLRKIGACLSAAPGAQQADGERILDQVALRPAAADALVRGADRLQARCSLLPGIAPQRRECACQFTHHVAAGAPGLGPQPAPP